MWQADDVLPDGDEDKGAGMAAPHAVDGEVAKPFVRVGNVESDGKHSQRVQDNDAQGDLAGGNLDGLLALEMPVLGCRQEDEIPAHEREEGRDHGGPKRSELSGRPRVDNRRLACRSRPRCEGGGSESPWRLVRPESGLVESLARAQDDVDHDQSHEEGDFDATKNVLESTVLAHGQEVDEKDDDEKQTDPHAGVRAQACRPLDGFLGVVEVAEIGRVDTEFENLGDG